MTYQSNHGLYFSGTYIPFVCVITGITKEDNCIVTTAVEHRFVIGNQVRFLIPQIWGMIQLNPLVGIVQSHTDTTITLDINTTNFDTFITPTITPPQVIDFAQVIPIGDQNTGYQKERFFPYLKIPGTFKNVYP
jgi:hypothetical protein